MSNTKRKESALMTSSEVAIYLRISRASVYRLAKNKGIPVSKIGRQLRFRKDAIDRWLSNKEHEVVE